MSTRRGVSSSSLRNFVVVRPGDDLPSQEWAVENAEYLQDKPLLMDRSMVQRFRQRQKMARRRSITSQAENSDEEGGDVHSRKVGGFAA